MAKVEIEDTELAALRAAAKNAEKFQVQAEALTSKLTAAEALAAKLPELEKVVGEYKTRELDNTFKAAGITDAKVRRYFELEHADVPADPATGAKPDLGTWLDGLKAMPADKRPVHLAPFIQGPAAGGAGAGGATRVPANLPDANKGAKGVENASGTFTPEQVRNMNVAELQAAWPALQATLPQLQGFNFPGSEKPN